MKQRIVGLTRNIFFLGLVSLFNDFSSEMVFSVFPPFFTAVLRAGAQALGLVDGIAEGLSNLFKIYSGRLSDRLQSRVPLVVFGYVLSVLTRPFYILASTVGAALGLRVLDRIGKGLRDAPRDALISLSIPQTELGKSFGYHRAMDTTGSILGPLVAYVILKRFPLRFGAVFVTAFIVGCFAVLTLFFVSEVTLSVPARQTNIVGAYRRLPSEFKVFLLSILVLSVGSLPVAVMLLKTQSIGLALADVPLFYTIYNLPYAGFSVSAGKLSDRVGAKAVIFMGYTVLIVGYFVVSVSESALPLAGSFFILGLFPALTDGVQRSLAAQLTVGELRGEALGLINAAVGIGTLLAGIGGGYLWQTYSPAAAFLAAASIVMIGLLLFGFSSPQWHHPHPADSI